MLPVLLSRRVNSVKLSLLPPLLLAVESRCCPSIIVLVRYAAEGFSPLVSHDSVESMLLLPGEVSRDNCWVLRLRLPIVECILCASLGLSGEIPELRTARVSGLRAIGDLGPAVSRGDWAGVWGFPGKVTVLRETGLILLGSSAVS